MSNIYLITSGKGGVGKSTVASALGLAFAAEGKRTIVVELDVGLRGLDLMFGVEDEAVYDLGNILRGECRLSDGIIPVTKDGKLSLIVAPSGISSRIDYDAVVSLCKALARYFDTVIIDAPAGIGVSLLIAPQVADVVLVVATPDYISARDAGRLAGMLEEQGARNVRLIINKVHHKKIKLNEISDLDTVIDMAGAQLIGVVPYDERLSVFDGEREKSKKSSLSEKVFANIVSRLMGDYVELLIQ